MKAGNIPAKSHPMEIMSNIMTIEAARSLDLLEAIDGTVEALVFTRRNIDAMSEACDKLLFRAENEPLTDEKLESEVIPSLEKVQDSLHLMRSVLSHKQAAAHDAPELESEDGVADAYDQVIEAATTLNRKVETLRWVLLERGADAEGEHKPNIMRNTSEIDSFLDNL
jgi:hypothetical protein